MNNEEKEKKNNNQIEQKDSSSEDSSESQNIILDFDEHPDTVIEKILIKIFNSIITNKNKNSKYIIPFQKKIKELCSKHESSDIILLLLTNIRSIIKKYRKKIYEMPNIIELRENDFQKYYFRSYSINEKYSNMYINFSIDKYPKNYGTSPKKIKYFDYYMVIKNLFYKLKDIKNCLKKSAPIIEKIFELPLSEFEKFSILECANEDYLNIIVYDSFIWNQILKNKTTKLKNVIREIIEDKKKNLKTMTNKIKFFNNYQLKMLKIAEIGSSIDERYPEDAKPVTEIKYKLKGYYDNINQLLNEEEEEYIQTNEEETEEIDIDIDNEEHNIKDTNFTNINMIRFNGKKINLEDNSFKKTVITSNTINSINNINISEGNNFKKINTINTISNINNFNKIISKENLEKNIQFNTIENLHENININNISNININNINNDKSNKINILNKEKIFKNQEHILFKNKKNRINKNNKESNNNSNNDKKYLNTKKNIKVDKKEIPSDIDDLVKYIENDDKNEIKNKKKKKNKKKTKKKNKNEDKKEENENQEDIKEKEENDEIKEIKDNFIKNSINRFKIHKIKFKYKKEWLEEITNKD